MSAKSVDQRNRSVSSNLMGRFSTSLVSFSLIQLALYLVPYFFPDSSVLTLLPLSAVALLALAGFGRFCRSLIRIRASAPAFVFLSIIFFWAVYIGVIRQAVSPFTDFILNTEFLMLMVGLCSMLSTEPGYITIESSHLNKLVESSVPVFEVHSKELALSTCCDTPSEFSAAENAIPHERARYCGHCKAYVKGFDHHCPAFGNCIGQKNHVLFVILLFGFVLAEASYVECSSQFCAKLHLLDISVHRTILSRNLAISTMLFSLLQLLWQVGFLSWHIYCVCFNIRTDEWINWRKYPEFHLIVSSEAGQTNARFTNPYDKGILSNVKEFLTAVE